jgi:hypothetical protein
MVPAGGRATVIVHADQSGESGDIGPERFTIPGLATSLQRQIYAESSAAMSGGKKIVSVVTQEEIDANLVQFENEIFNMACEQLRATGKGNWTGEVFVAQPAERTVSVQAGQESDVIAITMKKRVAGVFYDAVAYNELASAKLYENLLDGFIFTDAAHEMDYGLSISDVGTSRTTLRADLSEEAIVANTNPFLQPEVFVGKTPEEVKNYLLSAGLASDVSVWIFPPWPRKVPGMIDHIVVQVVD